MKLSGNTILITGGTSGIGKGLAERLVALGNKVIVCGRRQQRLEQLKDSYPDIDVITCDVMDSKSRVLLAEKVAREYPELNVLINNAGIQLAQDLTRPVDLANVEQEVDTNFVAPVHLSSLLVDHLKLQPNAAIVNISSGLAYTPLAFMPVYCATKAAVHSWSMSLRKQLDATSVRVYEIAPPSVDTELGYQRREDKTKSHGGMPISEFVDGAIEALQNDEYQAGVGPAAQMMKLRDSMFDQLNSR